MVAPVGGLLAPHRRGGAGPRYRGTGKYPKRKPEKIHDMA